MKDKRPVDQLSVEELEKALAIRRREEREKRLTRMKEDGRVIANVAPPPQVQASVMAAPLPLAAAPAATGPANDYAEPAFPPPMDGPSPAFEDDPYDTYALADSNARQSSKRFMNGLLLFVEIAAIAGLIFIAVNLFFAINTLEDETAQAVALADEQRRAGIPTIAPTPVVTLNAVVLPGGHTFSASGVPQFNYAEIPSHLLPLVQDQIVEPPPRRPPATDNTPLRLIIPKLNVDQTIVQGVDWEALRQGIGQLPNGYDPSLEIANVVFAAHNDIYGEFFRDLDRLAPGDQFQVQTRSQVYSYTITETRIVEPTNVEVMELQGDRSIVTLISCYPYQVNNQRIVVFAQRS